MKKYFSFNTCKSYIEQQKVHKLHYYTIPKPIQSLNVDISFFLQSTSKQKR